MASEQGLIVDGLKNQGNICYFNSILQALASCNIVLDSLQRIQSVISDHVIHENREGQTLCHGLLDLIKTLQPHSPTTSAKSHSAQTLLRTLRTKFGGQDVLPLGEEHDAAEGLELLLQALSSEISTAFHVNSQSPLQIKAALQAVLNPKFYFSPVTSVDALFHGWRDIRLPCEGLLATRMQCVKCRHHFDTQYTQSTTLSMPLPTSTASTKTKVAAAGNLLGIARVRPGCNLIPCFDGMFGYEIVSGVHCPGCSIRASFKQLSPQSASPATSPPRLPSTMTNKNKKQPFLIPPTLQQLQQCVDERRPLPTESYAQAAFQAANIPYLGQTQTQVTRQSVVVRWPPVLVLHLRRSIWTPDGRLMKVVGHVKFPLALRLQAKDNQKVSYQLQAVVHHSGLSSITGHYVTFRKLKATMGGKNSQASTSSTRWVKVSDEDVKPVEEAEVLAADAILLLYEKF